MTQFYGRGVFFVKDAEQSLAYYKDTLGFTIDWNHQEDGRAYVFQASLFGFQLILNQVDARTTARAGHGRVFVGLEDDQAECLQTHIHNNSIKTQVAQWGNPTLVIHDLDGNELFFSLPAGGR